MLLEREQAPCLLVKDTDTQFGIMTPTDIVKKVVAQGLEPHDIEVRTIMTRPVQFIEYDEALAEASTLMMATGASLLIVTKQNQPVGVLSAQDLMLTPPRRGTRIPVVVSVVGRASAQGLNFNAMITQLSHVGASSRIDREDSNRNERRTGIFHSWSKHSLNPSWDSPD